MPTVTLTDEAFAGLKSLAEPFVDTPESLVTDLIHAEMQRRGVSSNGNGHTDRPHNQALRLNPDAHDNLKHTRVLSASLNRKEIHRPKWNSILEQLHHLGYERLGSCDALRQASGASIRQGRYEQEGYKYLPEIDLSLQGVDSNKAWDHSLKLARALNIPIAVEFEWRNKDGAAHPGKTGVLEWTPHTP